MRRTQWPRLQPGRASNNDCHQEHGDQVRVSVVDQGHGIPAEQMSRLFEPFFTTKEQGLGLGLSISRSIIAAHSGRLWAENNLDRGVTIHLALPVSG